MPNLDPDSLGLVAEFVPIDSHAEFDDLCTVGKVFKKALHTQHDYRYKMLYEKYIAAIEGLKNNISNKSPVDGLSGQVKLKMKEKPNGVSWRQFFEQEWIPHPALSLSLPPPPSVNKEGIDRVLILRQQSMGCFHNKLGYLLLGDIEHVEGKTERDGEEQLPPSFFKASKASDLSFSEHLDYLSIIENGLPSSSLSVSFIPKSGYRQDEGIPPSRIPCNSGAFSRLMSFIYLHVYESEGSFWSTTTNRTWCALLENKREIDRFIDLKATKIRSYSQMDTPPEMEENMFQQVGKSRSSSDMMFHSAHLEFKKTVSS